MQVFIKIWQSEDGYMFDIFDHKPTDDSEALDGGLCTGSRDEAIELAVSTAKDYLAANQLTFSSLYVSVE